MPQIHYMLSTGFTIALTGTIMNRTHMMSMLLGIEAMTLSLFMLTSTLSANSLNTTAAPIILITLAACEAGAGLTLLTLSSKENTNDHLKNLNLLKC